MADVFTEFMRAFVERGIAGNVPLVALHAVLPGNISNLGLQVIVKPKHHDNEVLPFIYPVYESISLGSPGCILWVK